MKRIISIFLLSITSFIAFSQENESVYTKDLGDKAYAEARYDDAVAIYEAVIAEEGATLPLYYNLGNAYYRTNNPGKAILNYERALQIDADDEDTKANLQFVQSMIVDKIPQDEVPFYKVWGRGFAGMFSKDTWGVIAVVTFITMLIALFFAIFKRNTRTISIIIASVCLLFTILSNVSAFSFANRGTDTPQGVILDEMVVVKSSPESSGTELTKIHEGLKVTIIDDTLDEWVKIEANNGNRVVGWIRKKSMERI